MQDENHEMLSKMKKKKCYKKMLIYVYKIITFPNKSGYHLDEQNALFSPVVKFIYYLSFDIATIDEVYKNYKAFLNLLAKQAVYANRDDHTIIYVLFRTYYL